MEERVIDELRVLDEHCGLTHVVEDQRREDQVEPRHGDRLAAEVAHIGIECFGTCHCIDDGAEREKRIERVRNEEPPDVYRVERSEDQRIGKDVCTPIAAIEKK